MKKRAVPVLVAVGIAIVGVLFIGSQLVQPVPKALPVRTDYPVVEFSGTLTGFVDDCLTDGECKAIVGDATITTVPGNAVPLPPVGKTDVNNDHVGKPVRIRAFQVSENSYTIVGDSTLFVLLATIR